MCDDRRCRYTVGEVKCPWEIGDHPASLADAREQRIVSEALAVTGRIPLAEAERMYANWKARWTPKAVSLDSSDG